MKVQTKSCCFIVIISIDKWYIYIYHLGVHLNRRNTHETANIRVPLR